MTDSKTNISFDEKYLAAIDLGTAKIGICVAKVYYMREVDIKKRDAAFAIALNMA